MSKLRKTPTKTKPVKAKEVEEMEADTPKKTTSKAKAPTKDSTPKKAVSKSSTKENESPQGSTPKKAPPKNSTPKKATPVKKTPTKSKESPKKKKKAEPSQEESDEDVPVQKKNKTKESSDKSEKVLEKSKGSTKKSSKAKAKEIEDEAEEETKTEEVVKKPREKITKYIVCSSSVAPELIPAVRELGGAKVDRLVVGNTTHLVIPSNCGRTMKVLEAISRGLFVLTEDWIADSQKEGKWLDESKYWATNLFPGAKKMRDCRKKSKIDQQLLFSDLTFYVNKSITLDANTTSVDVEKMITRNGGRCIHVSDGANYAIVINHRTAANDDECKDIRIEWLWDALTNFRIPDHKDFPPPPKQKPALITKPPKTEKKKTDKPKAITKKAPKEKSEEVKDGAEDGSETTDGESEKPVLEKKVTKRDRKSDDTDGSDGDEPKSKKSKKQVPEINSYDLTKGGNESVDIGADSESQ